MAFLDDLSTLVRRLGFEAKRNAPLAVMVVAASLIYVLLAQGFKGESVVLLGAVAAFVIGAFTATLGYLQQTRASVAEVAAPRPVRAPSPSAAGVAVEPVQHIRSISDGIIGRLNEQVARLGYRANVNLAAGASICLIGFCVLGYFVFFESKALEQARTFEFAVRVTLVVFVEVFAYFFLNLYRAGLYDIKYFQNELTNAAFRIMAMEVALAKGDLASVKKICDELSRTERNFLIKKNESTHDLRQAELLLQNEKSVSSTLERTLKAVIGSPSSDLHTDGGRRGARPRPSSASDPLPP